jgi:hypothetical protein
MARFQMSPPPKFPRQVAYGRYRPWLRENFKNRSCGYCLVAHTATQIDHYEPQGYRKDRINDPHNLILACASCNGSKLDYHPSHAARNVEKAGKHLVLDLRNEDLAGFFELRADGKLEHRHYIAQGYDRAVFSDSLMDLNHDDKKERRADYVAAVETLAELAKSKVPRDPAVVKAIRILEKTISDFHVLRTAMSA